MSFESATTQPQNGNMRVIADTSTLLTAHTLDQPRRAVLPPAFTEWSKAAEACRAIARSGQATATPAISGRRGGGDLRHRLTERGPGVGFGDQPAGHLGWVILTASRVGVQQTECVPHRHIDAFA